MIETLGELKKQMAEAIIMQECMTESKFLYYREYDEDPIFVIEISAIKDTQYRKNQIKLAKGKE